PVLIDGLRFVLRGALRSVLTGLGLILNGEQLDLKDQRGVWPDNATGAALAVGQIGGNKQLPLRSYRHKQQRLVPALDHLTDLKGSRLATFIGAVEFRFVEKSAPVVADDGVRG